MRFFIVFVILLLRFCCFFVLNDKEKADFYSFVRALDAAKKTMNSENKTLILDKESPLTQIFINGAGAE